MRRESSNGEWLVVTANFTPETLSNYRIGVPKQGFYSEILNTDGARYGGSNLGNMGGKSTDQWGIHGYEHSLELCLPALSVLVLRYDQKPGIDIERKSKTCEETVL